MKNQKTLWLVGLGLLAGALGACAGELDNPERFAAAVRKYESGGGTGGSSSPPLEDASLEDSSKEDAPTAGPPECVLQLFKASCALAGCHAKGLAQVDLASAGVAERLIEQTSENEMCEGRMFIATNGESSLLLDKLTDSPPCGAKMPLGGTISEKSKQCLVSWVSSLSGAELDAGAEP